MQWFMDFMKKEEMAAAAAAAEAKMLAAKSPTGLSPAVTKALAEMALRNGGPEALAQQQLMALGAPKAKAAPSHTPKINVAKNPAMKNPAMVAASAKSAPPKQAMPATTLPPVPQNMSAFNALSPPSLGAFTPMQSGIHPGVMGGNVFAKPTPAVKAACLQYAMGGCTLGAACSFSHNMTT